jgi:hypothetical protein
MDVCLVVSVFQATAIGTIGTAGCVLGRRPKISCEERAHLIQSVQLVQLEQLEQPWHPVQLSDFSQESQFVQLEQSVQSTQSVQLSQPLPKGTDLAEGS